MLNFLDNNMADGADTGEENLKIFCQLGSEQVKAKNRLGTHLNKQGYCNVYITPKLGDAAAANAN